MVYVVCILCAFILITNVLVYLKLKKQKEFNLKSIASSCIKVVKLDTDDLYLKYVSLKKKLEAHYDDLNTDVYCLNDKIKNIEQYIENINEKLFEENGYCVGCPYDNGSKWCRKRLRTHRVINRKHCRWFYGNKMKK